jgi:hypothetical protein
MCEGGGSDRSRLQEGERSVNSIWDCAAALHINYSPEVSIIIVGKIDERAVNVNRAE